MTGNIQDTVIERLSKVIDPETHTDVIRMHLVENLVVDNFGKVCYTFRPSSFVCPLAVSLAIDIKKAVAEVPGVTSQEISIAGYMAAEELEKLINKEI